MDSPASVSVTGSFHSRRDHNPYFRREYKPGSSLCMHAIHLMDYKDPDVYVQDIAMR